MRRLQLLLVSLCATGFVSVVQCSGPAGAAPATGEVAEQHGIHDAYAVLWPWVVIALCVVIYFLLSRFCHFLPYTAMVFLMGTLMGIGITHSEKWDQLTQSINLWADIEGEVLLLVFLPGLLFKDALSLDDHVFKLAFWQCLIFAFPMVLAGTALTACVAMWVFPYDWSWNFCMTFGAILSATDPVAVNSLLNEVGAPPRLKVHISGESLLNDGSSIVFYGIFSAMYLAELGIPGVGETIDVGGGFEKFFRMAGGGAAIGIAFGFALCRVLYLLDRRLNKEENVIQVSATIAVAYITYYVADLCAKTSGVIAVVFCGIVVRIFGSSMINQHDLMEHFWHTTEHLLNSVLFCLGGVTWGRVISNYYETEFTARDWGFLVVIYCMCMVIRLVLVLGCYPITANICIGSNVKEALFMSWGGLRGAVGIALAITLNTEVHSITLQQEGAREWTVIMFGMVGGMAFLTLVINGTLAGPILKSMGLADTSDTRKAMVAAYRLTYNEFVLQSFIKQLTDERYCKVDYKVVKKHVPSLRNVTKEEFLAAMERNKKSVHSTHYMTPYIGPVMDHYDGPDGGKRVRSTLHAHLKNPSFKVAATKTLEEEIDAEEKGVVSISTENLDEEKCKEIRLLFLEILGRSYSVMMEKGMLDGRSGMVTRALTEGLAFAVDDARAGSHLSDWFRSYDLSTRRLWLLSYIFGLWNSAFRIIASKKTRTVNKTVSRQTFGVTLAFAFMGAHQRTRKRFKREFVGDRALSPEEVQVFHESEQEEEEVRHLLLAVDPDLLEEIVAHQLCVTLLNKGVAHVERTVANGVLTENEAEAYLNEVEHELEHIKECKSCFADSDGMNTNSETKHDH